MRLIFVREEDHCLVIVNGNARKLPTAPLSVPLKVRAVQVYDQYTEVENSDLTNDVTAEAPAYVGDVIKAWQDQTAADLAKLEREVIEARELEKGVDITL